MVGKAAAVLKVVFQKNTWLKHGLKQKADELFALELINSHLLNLLNIAKFY